MSYRKQLRVLYRANSGVAIASATDITDKCRTPNEQTASIPQAATGYLYLGFHAKFLSRYFYLSTASTQTPNTMTVEFYNGSDWTEVEDLVDHTSGFTASGFVFWGIPEGSQWEKHELIDNDNLDLYWIRISFSSALSAGATLQAIMDLYLDTEDVSLLYSHLINDTRWYPKGQTTWYPTLLKASEYTAKKMIQRKLITDPAQIVDINQVSEAAIHAFAVIVYRPGAHASEERFKQYKVALDAFQNELSETRIEVDLDESGKIEPVEEDRPTIAFNARR